MSDNKRTPLKIVTRSSLLALAQARWVGQALGVPTELIPLRTAGDRTPGPLVEVGGKGLFTAELEAALRRGEAHLAVHSAKDLPVEMSDDLVIAAVPTREDPRDALVTPSGAAFADLPPAAKVGTSSLRRLAQVLSFRPDAKVLPLRGNVDTRIRKLREGQFEAIILAMAGLRRLGLLEQLGRMVRPLEIEDFVPAAGQGALAVQCLARDDETRKIVSTINDPDAAAALSAERAVLKGLGADCRWTVGLHAWRDGAAWRALAMVAGQGGKPLIRLAVQAASPEQVAQDLLDRLDQAGAKDLLRPADNRRG